MRPIRELFRRFYADTLEQPDGAAVKWEHVLNLALLGDRVLDYAIALNPIELTDVRINWRLLFKRPIVLID